MTVSSVSSFSKFSFPYYRIGVESYLNKIPLHNYLRSAVKRGFVPVPWLCVYVWSRSFMQLRLLNIQCKRGSPCITRNTSTLYNQLCCSTLVIQASVFRHTRHYTNISHVDGYITLLTSHWALELANIGSWIFPQFRFLYNNVVSVPYS